MPISGTSDEYTYRATITESDITSMNRYIIEFFMLHGSGKISSRAEQLCTKCASKCNKNSSIQWSFFDHVVKVIIYVGRNLIIKRLLWRIIEIIFFFRSVLISFSSISSHRSDIAFVNRYNRIFHILRAPRKIFSRIVRTRTSTSSGFISVFTNRNRDKSKQNNSNKFTFLLVKIFAKEKKNEPKFHSNFSWLDEKRLYRRLYYTKSASLS